MTVVDGDTLEVVKTIPTSRRPRGIIANPDGKKVYVAAGDGDIIDVIDTAKLEVVRQFESGPDPELMAVDPKGGTLYVANEDDSMATVTNDMTVIDVASLKAEKSVPVGRLPWGVAVGAVASEGGRQAVRAEMGQARSLARFSLSRRERRSAPPRPAR